MSLPQQQFQPSQQQQQQQNILEDQNQDVLVTKNNQIIKPKKQYDIFHYLATLTINTVIATIVDEIFLSYHDDTVGDKVLNLYQAFWIEYFIISLALYFIWTKRVKRKLFYYSLFSVYGLSCGIIFILIYWVQGYGEYFSIKFEKTKDNSYCKVENIRLFDIDGTEAYSSIQISFTDKNGDQRIGQACASSNYKTDLIHFPRPLKFYHNGDMMDCGYKKGKGVVEVFFPQDQKDMYGVPHNISDSSSGISSNDDDISSSGSSRRRNLEEFEYYGPQRECPYPFDIIQVKIPSWLCIEFPYDLQTKKEIIGKQFECYYSVYGEEGSAKSGFNNGKDVVDQKNFYLVMIGSDQPYLNHNDLIILFSFFYIPAHTFTHLIWIQYFAFFLQHCFQKRLNCCLKPKKVITQSMAISAIMKEGSKKVDIQQQQSMQQQQQQLSKRNSENGEMIPVSPASRLNENQQFLGSLQNNNNSGLRKQNINSFFRNNNKQGSFNSNSNNNIIVQQQQQQLESPRVIINPASQPQIIPEQQQQIIYQQFMQQQQQYFNQFMLPPPPPLFPQNMNYLPPIQQQYYQMLQTQHQSYMQIFNKQQKDIQQEIKKNLKKLEVSMQNGEDIKQVVSQYQQAPIQLDIQQVVSQYQPLFNQNCVQSQYLDEEDQLQQEDDIQQQEQDEQEEEKQFQQYNSNDQNTLFKQHQTEYVQQNGSQNQNQNDQQYNNAQQQLYDTQQHLMQQNQMININDPLINQYQTIYMPQNQLQIQQYLMQQQQLQMVNRQTQLIQFESMSNQANFLTANNNNFPPTKSNSKKQSNIKDIMEQRGEGEQDDNFFLSDDYFGLQQQEQEQRLQEKEQQLQQKQKDILVNNTERNINNNEVYMQQKKLDLEDQEGESISSDIS